MTTLSDGDRRAVARWLGIATAVACVSTPAAGQTLPVACGTSVDETRWLAESYHETHTYGLGGEEEWIGSYGGLAVAGDSLFLYDQLRPRIVHLSGELEQRHAFGRQGEGPGEFNWAVPIGWLDDVAEGHVAFDGCHLVVYDRHDLASFDAAGKFRWSAQVSRFTLGRSGLVFASPVDEDQMIFGLDSLAAGSRHLQLWKVVRPGHRQLLWQRLAPRLASDDHSFHPREARSYWARHQNCVVVSDGGSPFLWMVDLSTLQTDSMALPEWEVPEFGELRSDLNPMTIGGLEVHEPGLLWRWRGLIVDPDGHVWLRAWTESREEFEVFVVSLASGESLHMDNPPGFPTAFGPPGVFYTARRKSETDEHYLVRLQGRQK